MAKYYRNTRTKSQKRNNNVTLKNTVRFWRHGEIGEQEVYVVEDPNISRPSPFVMEAFVNDCKMKVFHKGDKYSVNLFPIAKRFKNGKIAAWGSFRHLNLVGEPEEICAMLTELSHDPENWEPEEEPAEKRKVSKAKPKPKPKAEAAPSKTVKKTAVKVKQFSSKDKAKVLDLLNELAELGFKASANKS